MAPKQKSIKTALFQKKAPSEATATPNSKTCPAGAAAADITPDGAPLKKRKAEAEELHEETKRPAKQVALATAPNGDSGPGSLWSAHTPVSQDLASSGFDPELRKAEFPAGKAVGFALISDALSQIEELKHSGKGSKKAMTVILSNAFRLLLFTRPEDLVPTVYILVNKVAPDYEQAELGVGDSTLLRAMCEVFGRSEATIKSSLAQGEAKDLGEVALLSRVAQKMLMMPAKLTIEKVFAEMKSLANASGKDSQKLKKEKIQKLLVASRGAEAKYIVRMLQAKLRIGIQMPTVLQALAYAFVLTKPVRGSAPAVSDIRRAEAKLSQTQLEAAMISMEAAVRQAFSEMPNFDKLIQALMDGCDGPSLLQRCCISLGVPVKPMLAKPAKGLQEVSARLSGKRFTGEWKYDGERAQIHVLSRDKIQVYSRNSENMTEKYPDVIKVIQDNLCEDVQNCIIDSELVAFDQVSKKILPFQVLSTRGRKSIAIENIKVNVCVYPFDCMVYNGTPIVKESLEKRRERLWKLLREEEGKLKFATYRNFDELAEEDIQAFLDESIAGSCEGLMLKTLSEDATYEPSKRSLNWLKLKKDYLTGMADSIDVVPIGAFYGKGRRTGAFGSYLLAIYDAEAEEYQTVCKTGTGFSDEDLASHSEFFRAKALDVPESNYNVSDKLKPDVWLEACQVWEIRAADLSISPVHTAAFGAKADGKGIALRFPRFLRIREDKSPEESTGPEQIVEMFEAQAVMGTDSNQAGDDDF